MAYTTINELDELNSNEVTGEEYLLVTNNSVDSEKLKITNISDFLSEDMADISETLTNKTLNDISNYINSNAVHFYGVAVQPIPKGAPVRLVVDTNDGYKIGLASGTEGRIIGIASEDIGTNQNGKFIILGTLTDFNTGDWEKGEALYLLNGELINFNPGGATVKVGYVIESGSTGSIMITNLNEAPDISDISLAGLDLSFSAGTIQDAVEYFDDAIVDINNLIAEQPKISRQDGAPANPDSGNLWIDSYTDKLKMYREKPSDSGTHSWSNFLFQEDLFTELLVSGDTIKTINGESILGSGDFNLTSSLTLTDHNLVFESVDGTTDTFDLAVYLDDTNLSRITTGYYSPGNKEILLTRNDDSIINIDISGMVTSVVGRTGDISLSISDINSLTSTLATKANLSGADFTGPITMTSDTTIALGSDLNSIFLIKDTENTQIFDVKENGDVTIGGVLTVNGTGTSTFAGDVAIGGSITVEEAATVTADFSANDLIVSGDLSVNGNTILGDNASNDTTTINGLTSVISNTTKALGSVNNSLFEVKDTLNEQLFAVKENGDVDIAGVINVYGDGTSYFAGDIDIAGSITVAESATASADFTANDLTVVGNLNVQGNTTLGDNPLVDVSTINGKTTIKTGVNKALGSAVINAFEILSLDTQKLFEVKENGDTVVGGSLTVSESATVTADFTSDNMTVTGNLNVNGNTYLGDAGSDLIVIKGKTSIESPTTKLLGNSNDNLFLIKDSEGTSLFDVKTNGNVNIAGDVDIAGSITISESSTVTADFTADNMTITGNIDVHGNTTLGDDALIDITNINGVTTIHSGTSKSLGNGTDNIFLIASNLEEELFSVKTNGNVDIAGAITVAEDATVSASLTSDNMTVQGNLNVQGNSTFGDDPNVDTSLFLSKTSVKSPTTKLLGSVNNTLFHVIDSEDTELFTVKENGDVDIAGVINVYGDGTSYFAGDVAIAGSITVAESATATADFAADNVTVTGNLSVQGNTTLGDASAEDITTINGVTSIVSPVTKALGTTVDNVFLIKSSDDVSLFDVKTNGDVNIAGVIHVNGDGTSTFAGDVSIGGSITVAESATVTADFTADNMTVQGNLRVEGNTILGDDAAGDITLIQGYTSILSPVTKAIGDNTTPVFEVTDSTLTPLLSVKTNGDVDIAGVINVYGDGTSYFAGDIDIAGSITVAENATATADFTADNLTVVGNLSVQGNTVLGDSSSEDTTTINGVTSIVSPTTKAAGLVENKAFEIKSADSVSLFDVRQNGDVNIAGVIHVNGDGTSTFAGDVSIGGSITVAENATVTADFAADNMTVNGNLNVAGNTILGDESTDTTVINGSTTINSFTSKLLGSDINELFLVQSSLNETLFSVMENGDVTIGGVIDVKGTGESTFAGSITIAENATVTADFATDNMTISGNLSVQGNTTLGNEATDTTNIIGVATAPTVVSTDDSNKIATTAFVKTVATQIAESEAAAVVDKIHHGTATITSSGNNTIDSFDVSTLKSGEYLLTVKSGSFRLTEKIVFHADSVPNVAFTSYASLGNNIGSFSLVVSGSTASLIFNSTEASGTVEFKREFIQ